MKVLLIMILFLLLVTCLCVAKEQEKEKKNLKRQIKSIESCNYLDTLTQTCSAIETKLIFSLIAFQL